MTELHGYKERSRAAALFIRDFTVVNGRPPSVREIKDHVGYSSLGATTQMLDRMMYEGLITKGPATSARSIRVVDAVTPEGPRRREREM